MPSDHQTYTEKLVRRIKYLENLLDTNKITYDTDDSIQKIIDNITISRDLSDSQLKRVLAERYSRQMFIPEVSTEGQEKLKNARVLIVGAGGIGSPAAMYLAGAGIGKLGIIDGDIVEESNLHRQIIHSNVKLGINKARSAKSAVLEFNPHINVEIFEEWLTPENAADVLDGYDIVLDASDNANARYLVNDICIIKKKTLVSGAAIRWEGQLTVLGLGDGPCYRCLYPQCPQPHMMQSCGDGGVIGIVPGIIGMLEALEAIKLIIGVEDILHKKFLMFDGKSCGFRKVKIRGRNPACISCGDNPTITDVKEYNYEAFTGLGKCIADLYVKLPDENNIVWKDFLPLHKEDGFKEENYLLDVRPLEQYKITSIDNAVNIPYSDFMLMNEGEIDNNDIKKEKTVYVLCRRGNFSRNAAQYLMDLGYKNVKNIVGGMNEYSRDFNPSVPSL